MKIFLAAILAPAFLRDPKNMRELASERTTFFRAARRLSTSAIFLARQARRAGSSPAPRDSGRINHIDLNPSQDVSRPFNLSRDDFPRRPSRDGIDGKRSTARGAKGNRRTGKARAAVQSRSEQL
ncbi:MAG: hypothetical protein K1X51_00140 [Rhodospirillaceae bacterium]|nr:hypothetical protein [Rhodospirillaceae bacterium]